MSPLPRMTTVVFGALLAGSLALNARSSKKEVSEQAMARARALLTSAASFSEKTPYSPTVQTVFLSYDADGNINRAIALRAFKSYEWVTAMVVVERKGDTFVVAHAEIPDIGRIAKPEKQQKVIGAIKSVQGRTVRNEAGTYKKIDAVTGATRYHKRIYLYFDKMAAALVAEMVKNPDWPKTLTQ